MHACMYICLPAFPTGGKQDLKFHFNFEANELVEVLRVIIRHSIIYQGRNNISFGYKIMLTVQAKMFLVL